MWRGIDVDSIGKPGNVSVYFIQLGLGVLLNNYPRVEVAEMQYVIPLTILLNFTFLKDYEERAQTLLDSLHKYLEIEEKKRVNTLSYKNKNEFLKFRAIASHEVSIYTFNI